MTQSSRRWVALANSFNTLEEFERKSMASAGKNGIDGMVNDESEFPYFDLRDIKMPPSEVSRKAAYLLNSSHPYDITRMEGILQVSRFLFTAPS